MVRFSIATKRTIRIDPEVVPDWHNVLSQARALDQIPQAQRGPLHGVAGAIKDVMNTKGVIRGPPRR